MPPEARANGLFDQLGESRAVRTEPIALRRLGCFRDENSELASAESAGLHAGKVRGTGEHRQDAAPSGAYASDLFSRPGDWGVATAATTTPKMGTSTPSLICPSPRRRRE